MTLWRPGQSGNPGGRRLTPEMREALELARRGSTKAMRFVLGMLDDAELDPKVRLRAAEVVLDRALGKPVQQVQPADAPPAEQSREEQIALLTAAREELLRQAAEERETMQ